MGSRSAVDAAEVQDMQRVRASLHSKLRDFYRIVTLLNFGEADSFPRSEGNTWHQLHCTAAVQVHRPGSIQEKLGASLRYRFISVVLMHGGAGREG
jgi:hypothetical protein